MKAPQPIMHSEQKSMISDGKLEDARHEVLAENTAQAVHKYLRKLFQEEARFRSRWVWELLQNARDASPEEGVRVSLIQRKDRVIFRHSGMPFTHKSVAHLIYHGSTKYDLSSIGQFGTGFLTTHLISKTVRVKGKMDDDSHFSFLLDRHGNDADQLKVIMDASWNAFTESLAKSTMNDDDEFSTEYEYPLTDSSVFEVVTEGIADLITNASYLLAFNDKIRSVKVEQPDRSVIIEKTACQSLKKIAECFNIREQSLGKDSVSRYVAVIANDGTSAAVEIAKSGESWSITEQVQVPRIFVAFPLTGTRNFCLPVVINNDKFQPREERDTLFLGPNNAGMQNENMIYMESAFDLATKLVMLGTGDDWGGAASLLKLGPLRQCDWIDENWFRSQVAERFIRPLRFAEILTTNHGGRITPAASMIPISDDSELCLDLWDIAIQIENISKQLPRRAETLVWVDNLKSWVPFLSESFEKLGESLTVEKVCEKVAMWGSVAEVRSQLSDQIDPIEWLNQLHIFISKAGLSRLFEKFRLVPSQSGALKKPIELWKDKGIDEELKDIAEHLGLTTRDDLLDRRMRITEILEIKPKTEDEVLSEALQGLKAKVKTFNGEIGNIAVRFFFWMVVHNKMDLLEGFPVLTRATVEGDPSLAMLFRDSTKPDEVLLAPILCWPEAARQVADLFPKRQTLSDDYHDALTDDAVWRNLASEGYIRLSPLYNTTKHVPFIPDEPFPSEEKGKKITHRTKDVVEVSALAFFEKDETGLDAVRSKIRAVSLLSFLASYVLEEDSKALDNIEADCECGEKHHYCRAAWLVPMWERRWVPIGENKRSSPSAKSIAQLFDGREAELRKITSGKGRKLLDALSISLADLSLRAVAKDEDTRISLIASLTDIVHAAGNDTEKVKLVAEEIRHSPQLLDEIRKHRERREKVQRNQTFGAEVERLLKEALENHGLKVTRTGIGSDYEIEEDYVVDDKEVILSIGNGRQSFLVEVKATLSNDARMTIKQAETAVGDSDRFILCMVRLDSREATLDLVQNQCRFVTDIGYQIKPVWEEYCRYIETKGEVCSRVGEIELIVQESEVRFAVSEGAWEGGLKLQEAVAQILSICRG